MSHSETMNSTDAAPAVDFMALLGRCLGNFKMVERVLATFRDTGRSDLDQLEAAVASSDFLAVKEISHRFKGAASNVSAVGLREVLAQAEQLGLEQEGSELTGTLTRLRLEWEDFLRYAEVFAPSHNNASQAATI